MARRSCEAAMFTGATSGAARDPAMSAIEPADLAVGHHGDLHRAARASHSGQCAFCRAGHASPVERERPRTFGDQDGSPRATRRRE